MTKQDRLIEAAAQAIVPFVPQTAFYEAAAKHAATAALDAILEGLREPSSAMMQAGMAAPNYLEDQTSRRGARNIWVAMIDALKAEPDTAA